MSTNIDPSGFPDIQVLQELTNRYFKYPDDLPADLPGNSDIAQTNPADISYNQLYYQSGVPDPFSTTPKSPVSLGGIGASPGALNVVNAIDLHNSNQQLPGSDLSIPDKVSPSVSGSGISPSAHHQNNEVDLSNPRTTLPDPHFSGNQESKKARHTEGVDADYTDYAIPYLTDGSSLFSFTHYIPSIVPSSVPVAQLPFPPVGINDDSYYFLKDIRNQSAFSQEISAKPTTGSQTNLAKPPFDINFVRSDFPILQERVNGKQLIWLDNAATTQKPRQVIKRISYFYEHENSNIHRAAHELAARATDAYEGARQKVKNFLNAASSNEIVFVRGTTEAINLVAKTFGEQYLQKGDEIIISHLEHHANIVPWQQLAQKKGLKLRVIPVDDDGQVILEEYGKLLNSRTRLVSFTHVSNALGTITPAKQIIEMAQSNGSRVLLDGAQSVSHLKVDLQWLNPDFFVFSGHKIFGPTGIGVLYGKEELLNSLQPWQGGGNMIKDVTFEHTQFHNAPFRFEAGTGNIADAVGLGAALDYVSQLGIQNINQYEHYLLLYATGRMKEVPGLSFIGTAPEKASVLSFSLKGYSNDEVGKVLSNEGIAVRTGHHCAQPILRRFGFESSVRPSLAFYNTCSEIDTMVDVLKGLKKR